MMRINEKAFAELDGIEEDALTEEQKADRRKRIHGDREFRKIAEDGERALKNLEKRTD